MRVFAVSGTSGSGKTTLIEGLVRTLRGRGYSVCTVKSSNRDLHDTVGSDTWRHMKAGASITVFLGHETTIIRRAVRARVNEVFQGDEADFLLIEGMKGAVVPRLWCVGDQEIDVREIPPNSQAVIVWEGVDVAVNGFDGTVLSSTELGQLSDIITDSAVELETVDL